MTDIEDKVKNVNAGKLPEILSAYCKICKKQENFVYFATQPNSLGEDIHLYNCIDCTGTRAYDTLIKNDKRKNLRH